MYVYVFAISISELFRNACSSDVQSTALHNTERGIESSCVGECLLMESSNNNGFLIMLPTTILSVGMVYQYTD